MNTFVKIVMLCIGYPIACFIGIFIMGIVVQSLGWLFIPDRSFEQYVALVVDSLGSTTKIWAAVMFVSIVGFVIKCFTRKKKNMRTDDTYKKTLVRPQKEENIALSNANTWEKLMHGDKLIIAAIIIASSIVAIGFLIRLCEYRYQWIGKDNPLAYRLGGVFDKKLGRVYTFGPDCLMIDYPNHKIEAESKDEIVEIVDEEIPDISDKAKIVK